MHRVEQYRRIELDVGAQRPVGMTFGEQVLGLAFDHACKRQTPRGHAAGLERADGPLERSRARIAHPVHAMTHAHNAASDSQFLFQPGPGP